MIMKDNMPKFGVLSNPANDIIKEIKSAHRNRFDFIEIGIEPPMGDPEILMSRKNAILSELKKDRLFALGHTAWWCDLGSPIEELRRVWIEEAKSYVDTANVLGIRLLNFHAHFSGMFMKIGKFKKQVLDNMIDSLEEIMGYAKPYGIQIILENIPRKEMSIKDFRYVMNQLPGLGMHLDIAHAFVAGGIKMVSQFINTFGDSIIHIHMSDNHGKDDEHLAIGKGNIDYERVVAELKKTGYDKTITFEVFFGGKKAVVDSRKRIEKIWSRNK